MTRSERECVDDLMAWEREAQRANVLVDILGSCVRTEQASREGRLPREIDDRCVVILGIE